MPNNNREHSALCRAIREYLSWKGAFVWPVVQGMGTYPGVADIVGVLKGGRIIAVEVKTGKGQLTGKQRAFLDNIEERGGVAICARSLVDVETAMRMEGA